MTRIVAHGSRLCHPPGARRTRPVNNRREQIGWYFYDWANSAFPTTVVTVFLGPWLTTVTKAAADAGGFVYPLGIKVHAGSFFPYVVSLSVLGQVLLLPVLGAVADYSHRKKEMLALFAYVGAGATLGLSGVAGTRYLPGGVLFVIANVSFGASVVFYNAFLPDIASPDRRNAVSSYGWALGYLGGGLLLALNLALFSQAVTLGLSTGAVVRLNLASAGAWWAAFTLIPLYTLKNRAPARRLPHGESYLTVGFHQLRRTLGGVRRYPQTVVVLAAVISVVLGVSQALRRALYSHMLPRGQEAEYFSLYEVSERGTSWLGPFLFGLALQLTGSYRIAILSLSVFFLLGLAVLAHVDVKRAVVEAGNEPPAKL